MPNPKLNYGVSFVNVTGPSSSKNTLKWLLRIDLGGGGVAIEGLGKL